MPAITIDQVASRAGQAVAVFSTRPTAPSIGYRCIRQNGLGAVAACAMWVSMASSGSAFTKSPFQYHCSPFGKNGSKSALIAGMGIGPIQLKSGAGKALRSGAIAFSPSPAGPANAEMIAHARLFQCSFGNGSWGGTVLRPTKAPRSSGAFGR